MRAQTVRATVAFALGLAALSSAGCLTGAFVWAYPRVTRTRAVPLEQAAGEVYVFRADYSGGTPLGFDKTPPDLECVLTPLATGEAVPAQSQFCVRRGWWYGLVGWGEGRTFGRHMTVRLYRPGYQTVVIYPRDLNTVPESATPADPSAPPVLPSSPDGVVWIPAKGINEQHEAVLKLLDYRFARLAPGSASPGHRRVLLFAASELERLARECPEAGCGWTSREQLLADAARYRELADGHPALPRALRAAGRGDLPHEPKQP